MEHIIEFAIFGAKALVIIIGIIVVLMTIASLAMKNKPEKESLEIKNLNKKFKKYTRKLNEGTLDKKELKKYLKSIKSEDKKASRANSNNKVYVLEFIGDKKASAVDNFAQEISAVLCVAKPEDEIVVNIESPGGYVHTYGLAAAQLERIKKQGCKLTVCVDKVAASGGYLMACTGDQILAAPFAIVGSIGVIAQIPNFNKILKKNDVEFKEITAGEYKRSVSLFGELTEKGIKKFTEDIENTHSLFKTFVGKYRTKLDIAKVATGEIWYGIDAINNGLVDLISTSDEYLFSKKDSSQIYSVKIVTKKSFVDKLSGSAAKIFNTVTNRFQFMS